MAEEVRGAWQKKFVLDLITRTGCSHEVAMVAMGLACEVRETAYMIGYNNGTRGTHCRKD